VDSDCGAVGGHTVCGGGPRAGTAGINSLTRSEAHYQGKKTDSRYTIVSLGHRPTVDTCGFGPRTAPTHCMPSYWPTL
jgi:hypothetical protein